MFSFKRIAQNAREEETHTELIFIYYDDIFVSAQERKKRKKQLQNILRFCNDILIPPNNN